ncbi:hypothetical protein LXT21_21505 [Myxococcus sp. K38C18041901]|uniref:hypothetical protein n=1 Tax=Myxococcus guangdongensis TaxID=2906760 RepID=UPI0020A7998D|nr:hypothetical protein [Myxococcus guangdongensis]MCP3061362.1 hypothetical protein [Myxococcus guangdongensis]
MFEKRQGSWRMGVVCALWALGSACGDAVVEPESPEPEVVSADPARHPERRGIGMLPLPPSGPSAMAITVDPRASLIVTEDAIVKNFTLLRVMTQLVTQSGVPGLTPLALFQDWWSTQAPPGCLPVFNTFPYECPRPESNQALVNPFINPGTNPDEYIPLALVNRFDLAPVSGSDCGEYRIVFGKRSGIPGGGNRNLLIFEAVLPNPNPAAGLNGCQPVANFWASLTGMTALSARVSALTGFYFNGLPGAGFMPVVHMDNYGNRAGAVATGQVRTNQFIGRPWTLREFSVRRTMCGGTPCQLRFTPVTVKVNPGGTLFNPASGHPLAATFQGSLFPGQVPALTVNDINLFNNTIPDTFNSGQSHVGVFENQYVAQFGPGPSPFHTNVQAAIVAAGSTLTPQQVVARSMALSCAGCHENSNGANLGGGLVWPPSGGFVHVGEQFDPLSGTFGPRYRISPALTNVFLPHRKAVLETFLNASCGDAVCQPWETTTVCPADCP